MSLSCRCICAGRGSRGGNRRISIGRWNRLSTYSRENRKQKLRCEINGGFSPLREFGRDEFGVDVVDEGSTFTGSLGVGPGLRDLDRVFGAPPIKLRSRLHRFLPVSSSARPPSDESVDAAEEGRGSASEIESSDDNLFELVFCTTPSNDRNGPPLVTTGLSFRIMSSLRLGAGLHGAVEGATFPFISASSRNQR